MKWYLQLIFSSIFLKSIDAAEKKPYDMTTSSLGSYFFLGLARDMSQKEIKLKDRMNSNKSSSSTNSANQSNCICNHQKK
jgi:hypothetical protein